MSWQPAMPDKRLQRLFLLLFATWFASCGRSGDSPRREADNTEPSTASETSVAINQVNLFLETSASMKGYLTGSTQFKSQVASLVSQVEKNKSGGLIKQANYYLIPQDTATQEVDNARTLLNNLKNNQLAAGKNSLIVDILTMLQNRNNAQTVNIFISDCILSDIDLDNQSIVREQVALLFNKYASANTATSIYAFTSDFSGNYYTYPTGVQMYTDVERPYYVWIFGNEQKVNALNQALRKANFEPEEELHFGFRFNQQPDFRVMNYAGKNGNFVVARNNQQLTDIELFRGRALEMGVGVDLSAYPASIASEKYLTKNLQLAGENAEGSVVSVQPVADVQLTKSDNTLAEKYRLTHVITLQISSIKGKQGSVELSLAKTESPWYKQWSVDDDRTIEQNEGKTFALQYLIEGVREAYRREDDAYFTINIPLVKE